MDERWLAFIIWTVFGILFIAMGVYELHAKKAVPFGFWANAKTAPVENVKAYNRALGKLWMIFGMVFVLLGFPMLAGEDSPYIIISIIGAAFESIAVMAVYVIKIEGKYKKR